MVVATGGEDGKLKLWDTESGFNYMTFAEHAAAINDLVFTPQVSDLAGRRGVVAAAGLCVTDSNLDLS